MRAAADLLNKMGLDAKVTLDDGECRSSPEQRWEQLYLLYQTLGTFSMESQPPHWEQQSPLNKDGTR